ncbi:MAG: DUF998 domain-containing protein [Dehalococcoidia bacterium]
MERRAYLVHRPLHLIHRPSRLPGLMTLSTHIQRRFALSGMLAPVTFTALAGAATFVTPDYDLLSDTVSRLAAPGQPYWWLVNASFVIYCLLVQPLGPLLHSWAPSRIAGAVLWLLIVQYGLGSSLAAVFRVADDHVVIGTLTADNLHHIAARVGFVGILTLTLAAPLLLRGVSGHAARWRKWRRFSLAMGLLTVAFMLPFQLDLLPAWSGLLQRAFFVTTLLWVFGTALWFYRLSALAEGSFPAATRSSTHERS